MKHLLSILLLLAGCTAAVEPTPEPASPSWMDVTWPPEGGVRHTPWVDGSHCPYPPESALDTLPLGDANKDGAVTADDYMSVQQHLGDYGPAGIYGDANWNGVVTDADTECVQQKMGRDYGEPVVELADNDGLIPQGE